MFFFFQAEDGIRYDLVTGVQTCALPIFRSKLYDERITDAFARFEQVERSLDELEGKAEVYDLGRKATLGEELAGLEAEAGIDEELAALKKRLGNSMGGNSMGGNSIPGGSSKADGR